MRTLAFILLMFCLQSFALADPPGRDWTEFADRMSVGGYTVIGRNPDSKMMYSGRISFDSKGSKLAFMRTINHVTIRGMASFESPPDCNNSVLRLRFRQNGQWYVGLYEWTVDIDNSLLFTGYVTSKKTKAPGWEAFYPDT